MSKSSGNLPSGIPRQNLVVRVAPFPPPVFNCVISRPKPPGLSSTLKEARLRNPRDFRPRKTVCSVSHTLKLSLGSQAPPEDHQPPYVYLVFFHSQFMLQETLFNKIARRVSWPGGS